MNDELERVRKEDAVFQPRYQPTICLGTKENHVKSQDSQRPDRVSTPPPEHELQLYYYV
jgi:hypothetical protein